MWSVSQTFMQIRHSNQTSEVLLRVSELQHQNLRKHVL